MTDNNEEMLSDHTITKDIVRLEPPKQYKVILHNDDYTPMDFVVQILMSVFKKNENSAMEIMLNVHRRGQGICGVYTYEIAESKIARVHQLAQEYEYPLKATMEEE